MARRDARYSPARGCGSRLLAARRTYRLRKATGLARAAALTVLLSQGQALAVPKRVVSINLCTDQLAMLLAAPGQLLSVTNWSLKPASSRRVEQARKFHINRGRSEDIVPLRPDLVLAGRYTKRATVNLLRHLGFRVEEFDPAESFADIKAQVRRMARLLGRKKQGTQALRAFAQLQEEPKGSRPLAVVYLSGGDTAGAGTLVDELLRYAGYRNLAAEIGLRGRQGLPLERLLAGRPEVLIFSSIAPDSPSLSMALLRHPALTRVVGRRQVIELAPHVWICPGPDVVETIQRLREQRR